MVFNLEVPIWKFRFGAFKSNYLVAVCQVDRSHIAQCHYLCIPICHFDVSGLPFQWIGGRRRRPRHSKGIEDKGIDIANRIIAVSETSLSSAVRVLEFLSCSQSVSPTSPYGYSWKFSMKLTKTFSSKTFHWKTFTQKRRQTPDCYLDCTVKLFEESPSSRSI